MMTLTQWRIQDFPKVGAPTNRGAPTYGFAKIFQKTVWNWKNLDSRGGRGGASKILQFRSATTDDTCKRAINHVKCSLLRKQRKPQYWTINKYDHLVSDLYSTIVKIRNVDISSDGSRECIRRGSLHVFKLRNDSEMREKMIYSNLNKGFLLYSFQFLTVFQTTFPRKHACVFGNSYPEMTMVAFRSFLIDFSSPW